MLYEYPYINNVQRQYQYSAQRECSWHRSNWHTQANQENGFYQLSSILTDFPDIRTVLDVGCGDGRIVDFLPEQIIDYTGIDITPEIVTVANKPYILHADIKTYQPQRKYDAVFAIGSFNIGVRFIDVIRALEAMHKLSNIATICNISYLCCYMPDERQILRNLGYTVIEHPHSFANGYADKYTLIKLHNTTEY